MEKSVLFDSNNFCIGEAANIGDRIAKLAEFGYRNGKHDFDRLAEKCNYAVSANRLYRIWHGESVRSGDSTIQKHKTSTATVISLCSACQVSASWLIFGTEYPFLTPAYIRSHNDLLSRALRNTYEARNGLVDAIWQQAETLFHQADAGEDDADGYALYAMRYRQARKYLGWSVKSFSRKINCSADTVYRAEHIPCPSENGADRFPDLDYLIRFCAATNVTPDFILYGSLIGPQSELVSDVFAYYDLAQQVSLLDFFSATR